MKNKLYLVFTLLALAAPPGQAVIPDDEDRAAKPEASAPKAAKPKPRQKSDAELEVERLKKQLAEERRKNSESERDETTTRESTANRGPNMEMISLPSGIKMGKYEVTQGQWRAVMGTNPSKFSGCGDDCPVEQVSWDDVQQFLQRLNQMTGQRFRLPSEDEWYAACQAGSYGSEYCGSNAIDAVAWYDGNAGNQTHRVGQKQANAWGLYDMSGNVWEWTNSCDENDCSYRLVRGGSWGSGPQFVRSAYRFRDAPGYRYNYLGFRLAQDR